MLDLALIIISCLLVYIIGYPLLEWFSKAKEEMEEKEDDFLK